MRPFENPTASRMAAFCVHADLDAGARALIDAIEKGCRTPDLYSKLAAFADSCRDHLPVLTTANTSGIEDWYVGRLARLCHALDARLTRYECGSAPLSSGDIRRHIERWLSDVQRMAVEKPEGSWPRVRGGKRPRTLDLVHRQIRRVPAA